METKLLVACCVFSFITGIYVAVLVYKDKEGANACTVTYRHGHITTVIVGRQE